MANSHQLEHEHLQAVIASIQNAMPNASQSARLVLETALGNAQKRLDELDKEIKQEEQCERAEQDVRIVAAAERETALSMSEKETYSGFLKEDFFTKKDFGRLEGFYAHTWDRLTEHGKDEMSHRVWEGVRKGEYKFGELPTDVRKKETTRAYGLLTKQSNQTTSISAIPEKDRQDFLRAYESNNQKEAEKVLERDSFKKELFLRTESESREHNAVNGGRDKEKTAIATNTSNSKPDGKLQKAPESAKQGDKDLSSLDLSGVKLAEVQTQGTSAEIPTAKTGSARRAIGG